MSHGRHAGERVGASRECATCSFYNLHSDLGVKPDRMRWRLRRSISFSAYQIPILYATINTRTFIVVIRSSITSSARNIVFERRGYTRQKATNFERRNNKMTNNIVWVVRAPCKYHTMSNKQMLNARYWWEGGGPSEYSLLFVL